MTGMRMIKTQQNEERFKKQENENLLNSEMEERKLTKIVAVSNFDLQN